MTRSSNTPIDLDHPYSDASDLPLRPSQIQQLGFMAPLHSDIILSIVSYLSQEDCLTCMSVCRDWFYAIPQYAQNVWTTINLDPSDACSENLCRIRCLGDHVKNVTFRYFDSEQELYYIMHKFLDWGCTRIESLEFKRCITSDQDAFLEALEKLSPYLTHLKMLDHGSNIAFLHTLKACPELTHFTYEVRMRLWQLHELYHQEPVVHNRPDLSSLKFSTKITHLCLDLTMTKPDRVYTILQCCPELRCYVGPTKRGFAGIYIDDFEYSTISLDLGRLFVLCPKINHIQPFFTIYAIDELGDTDLYTNDPNCTGLRKLDICEEYGGDHIAAYLFKSQDTLEHLSLQAYHSDLWLDWSSVFRSLQLTRLHTLKLDVLHYDTASLIAMLNHCPALETLGLSCINRVLDPSIIQALSALDRLRSLKFSCLNIDDVCFKMLLDRLPALETLSLSTVFISLTTPQYTAHATNQLKHLRLCCVHWRISNIDDTYNEEEAVAQFLRYWTAHSKLETFTMTNVPIFGRNALHSVADIPTLKDCNIVLDPAHCFNEDDLVRFATKLRGTAIEKLELRGAKHMSYRILNALTELPLLREFHLSQLDSTSIYCYKISVFGLLQMLRRSSSLAFMTFDHYLLDSYSEVVPDHDSLSALIKQETPWYYVEKEEEYPAIGLSIVAYGVIIRRRA